MSRCSSGKLAFRKQESANRAITRAAERGELPPMRHYKCPECGKWHLSRKEGRGLVELSESAESLILDEQETRQAREIEARADRRAER